MDNVKHVSTPMASSTKIDQDLDGNYVKEKTYRGMIGSLTTSHPDIMFSV